jgi:hypothetical protein
VASVVVVVAAVVVVVAKRQLSVLEMKFTMDYK